MIKKKIAIFQAYHGLQIHTLNVIDELLNSGFYVDFYTYKCKSNYIDLNPRENLNIYDYSYLAQLWNEKQKFTKQIIEAFIFYILAPLSLSVIKLFPKKVFKQSLNDFCDETYHCIIAVEKMGLIWSNLLTNKKETPIIYYSLELYSLRLVFSLTGEYFPFLRALRFIKVKLLEAHYHKTAVATIIQDELRAKEISRYNSLTRMMFLYLPISLRGAINLDRTNYLHNKLSIPPWKKILINFGTIGTNRMVLDIARAAQRLDEEWIIIMHGPALEKEIIQRIKLIDTKAKVVISTGLIPENEINKMIGSADVGLCFYPSNTSNDLLAGFSSEKLARYLQCGLPIISYNYLSFRKSIEETGSGKCIHTIEELSNAITEITKSYQIFRANAFLTYQRVFNYSLNFEKVISFINNLGNFLI